MSHPLARTAVVVLLLIWLFTGSVVAADFVWAKRMGASNDDYGTSIAIDGAGNILTTGNFDGTVDFDPGPGTYELSVGGPGSHAAFVSKLDASGNFVWAVQFGTYPAGAEGHAVAVDSLGNVYTVGLFAGTVDFDPGPGVYELTSTPFGQDGFVSKLDANGNFLWAFRMGSANFFDIAVSSAGKVVIAGFAYTPQFGEFAAVWANDSNGTFDWSAPMLGGYSHALAVDVDSFGSVYATGFFNGTVDFDPGPDVYNLTTNQWSNESFVTKFDIDGNFVWAKRLGGLTNDDGSQGAGLVVDAAGDVFTTGSFSGTVDFDPGPGSYDLTAEGATGNTDVFVSKLDTSGGFVWARNMGGFFSASGSAISLDGAGNVYTTGFFNYEADFDPGPGVYSLTGLPYGNVYTIFVSRLDAAGNFVWAGSMGRLPQPDIAPYANWGQSIATDGAGNIYVTGTFGNTTDFDPGPAEYLLGSSGSSDIFVAKLAQHPAVRFTDRTTLSWGSVPGGATYNTYRSDSALPGSFLCRASGLVSTVWVDPEEPGLGALFAYLVTAVTANGQEGSMGFEAIDGLPTVERPNSNPCP